jgi:hypothetical protein
LRDLKHAPLQWSFPGLLKLSRFWEMATIHVLPFLAGGLWWYSRKKRVAPRDRSESGILFFLLWGGLTFIRAWLRGGNTTALIQSATPLYVVLVLLLGPLVTHARETRKWGARLAAVSTAFALVGLGQWAMALTLQEAAGQESYRAVAPYGTLAFADAGQAAEMQSLIDAVVENSTAG